MISFRPKDRTPKDECQCCDPVNWLPTSIFLP
jgi:hypothetical protein